MSSPDDFITKDSGQRQKFPSGMQRDVTGDKTLYHLTQDGPMFRRWAELLTRGAKKYNARNWMKSNSSDELDRAMESAFRHFIQWASGETDEDHAAAVFFNINMVEYLKGKLSLGIDQESDELKALLTRLARDPVDFYDIIAEAK